jgi:hypothetical protein
MLTAPPNSCRRNQYPSMKLAGTATVRTKMPKISSMWMRTLGYRTT